MLKEHREPWRLAARTTVEEFVSYLKDSLHLNEVTLSSDRYGALSRFAWPGASPFEIALATRKGSYLSHASAIYLHGFTDQLPRTIYVNKEQSPKPSGGELSQDGLDRAFSRPQRTTQFIFAWDEYRFVLLNGKHTDRLGVRAVDGANGELMDVTDAERTLIDIAVRPAYAGGIYQVLAAYEGACDRVSVGRLIATLRKLNHLYPYQQSIGFLMERANYPGNMLDRMRRLRTDFDFYLVNQIADPEYSRDWRLYFPRGL